MLFGSSQTSSPIPSDDDRIIVSYKGNMGILITSPKTSVLIDGLHEYYGPSYLNPPDAEVRKILNRNQPYSNLDLVLFTHFHKDHYSEKLAKDFLQSSARNRVIGSPQVIGSLPGANTVNSWNKNAVLLTDTVSGVVVHGFNIPHVWQERHSTVQNVAYLIKLNNATTFHVGDADTDIAAFSRLKPGKVDVMIVPVWFLMNKEGIRIIQEIIKPGTVIATHISPDESQAMDKYKLPGIETFFFTTINQAVKIKM
jgi:L-ascorbate metabolism protein UlaG (beta-lactamase superfamily)